MVDRFRREGDCQKKERDRAKARAVLERWYPRARTFLLIFLYAQLGWIPRLIFGDERLELFLGPTVPFVFLGVLYFVVMYLSLGCIFATIQILRFDPDLSSTSRRRLAILLALFHFFAGPLIIFFHGRRRLRRAPS